MDELKNEVRRFLEVTEMPKTRFARKIGITSTALALWLNGDCNLTDDRIEKMKVIIGRIKILW